VTLRISPSGSGPITFQVSKSGYVPVTGRITVAPSPAAASVSALRPSLLLQPAGTTSTHEARVHDSLYFQWVARAGPTDRGSLSFADGSVMDIDHNTQVSIKSPSRTFLQTGQVFLQIVSGGQSHDIETGSAVAASLGTRYLVSVKGKVTVVTVLSGRLIVHNGGKAVSIGANQQSSITGNAPPGAPHTVNAANLVTWASGLPVAPNAATARIAYLLLQHGTQLGTFSLDNHDPEQR
jgi:ferric-dicitrate binding protein FerR (iron transport regulator)